MIEVKVCISDDKVAGIVINGHASSLICAGVSSCFVGAVNAVRDIEKFKYQAVEGDSYLKRIEKISNHDETVLETLFIQLLTISEKYPDEVKISRERV